MSLCVASCTSTHDTYATTSQMLGLAGRVTQVVAHPPSKCKTLSSNLRTTKKKEILKPNTGIIGICHWHPALKNQFLTHKNCTYLSHTTWCFKLCMHCKMPKLR
jgi:hypothetical protein